MGELFQENGHSHTRDRGRPCDIVQNSFGIKQRSVPLSGFRQEVLPAHCWRERENSDNFVCSHQLLGTKAEIERALKWAHWKADILAWKASKKLCKINVHCLIPTATRKRFQGPTAEKGMLEWRDEHEGKFWWEKCKPNHFPGRTFLRKLEDKGSFFCGLQWAELGCVFFYFRRVALLWIVPFACFLLPRNGTS